VVVVLDGGGEIDEEGVDAERVGGMLAMGWLSVDGLGRSRSTALDRINRQDGWKSVLKKRWVAAVLLR
jgi:hypothetical protein